MFDQIMITVLCYIISLGEVLAIEKLYVYSWNDSIPESVIARFFQETNIHIKLTSYENNETMFAKIALLSQYQSYDIIFPSSYYIKKLLDNHLLHKIDKEKIPNYKFLYPHFLNLAFDPGNDYSLPFAVYLTGILYNKKYIQYPQQSWHELLYYAHQNKVHLLDDMREVFHIMLNMLNYNNNNINIKEITIAYKALQKLMLKVRLLASESMQNNFISEEVLIGMCWNSEAEYIIQNDSRFAFLFPKEGSIMSIDNFAILHNSKNIINAYKFINFVMRPDISKEIMEYFLITIPNFKAKNLLREAITAKNILFPSNDQVQNSILHEYLYDINNKYLALWERLKEF